MRNKFKAIINLIRGRPVMYRMTLHIPEGWTAVSYGDIPNSMFRESENKDALIIGCTFMGEAAGIDVGDSDDR